MFLSWSYTLDLKTGFNLLEHFVNLNSHQNLSYLKQIASSKLFISKISKMLKLNQGENLSSFSPTENIIMLLSFLILSSKLFVLLNRAAEEK